MKVALFLRIGRAVVDLSRRELAHHAGVSHTTVWRLEQGDQRVSPRSRAAVLSALLNLALDKDIVPPQAESEKG